MPAQRDLGVVVILLLESYVADRDLATVSKRSGLPDHVVTVDHCGRRPIVRTERPPS